MFVPVQAKESWDLSTDEKLAEAAARKENGNAKFKAGNNPLAIKKYKVCIRGRAKELR